MSATLSPKTENEETNEEAIVRIPMEEHRQSGITGEERILGFVRDMMSNLSNDIRGIRDMVNPLMHEYQFRRAQYMEQSEHDLRHVMETPVNKTKKAAKRSSISADADQSGNILKTPGSSSRSKSSISGNSFKSSSSDESSERASTERGQQYMFTDLRKARVRKDSRDKGIRDMDDIIMESKITRKSLKPRQEITPKLGSRGNESQAKVAKSHSIPENASLYNRKARQDELKVPRGREAVQRTTTIELPKMRLAAFKPQLVLKFIDDILDYESLAKQEVRVAERLEKWQIEMIATRFDTSERRVKLCSDEEILHAISLFFEPPNKLVFYQRMEDALKSYEWKWKDDYKLTQGNFYIYHDHLKRYCAYFQRIYYMLKGVAQEDAIPAINFKENGLLKLFCKYEKCQYAYKYMKSASVQNFKSMSKFIDHILAQAEHSYQLSHTALRDSVLFKESVNADKDEEDAIPKLSKPSRKFNVHHMTEDSQIMHVTLKSDVTDAHGYGAKSSKTNELDLEASGKLQDIRHNATEISDISEVSDLFDEQYNQVVTESLNEIRGAPPFSKPKTDNSNLGCFKAMTEGRCDKESCSFSHDPEVLRQQCKEWIAKMTKEPFKNGVTRGNSGQLWKPPSRVPPARPTGDKR